MLRFQQAIRIPQNYHTSPELNGGGCSEPVSVFRLKVTVFGTCVYDLLMVSEGGTHFLRLRVCICEIPDLCVCQRVYLPTAPLI